MTLKKDFDFCPKNTFGFASSIFLSSGLDFKWNVLKNVGVEHYNEYFRKDLKNWNGCFAKETKNINIE